MTNSDRRAVLLSFSDEAKKEKETRAFVGELDDLGYKDKFATPGTHLELKKWGFSSVDLFAVGGHKPRAGRDIVFVSSDVSDAIVRDSPAAPPDLPKHGLRFDLVCVRLSPPGTRERESGGVKLRRGIDIGGETFIGLAASAVKPVVAAKADYDFLLKWIGAGMPDKMRVSRVLGIIAELERVRYDLCSLNTTEQEKIPVLLSPRTKVDEIDRDSDKLREFLRALLETVTA